MHGLGPRSVAAALRRVPPATLVVLVALLLAVDVVELGWRDPSPALGLDVPLPGSAEPPVERLRAVPLNDADSLQGARIA